MKVKQLKAQATAGTTATPLPEELRKSLNGLTINEALAKGFIDDIGDAKGNFMFNDARDGVDAAYAWIQGHAVRLSGSLRAGVDDIDEQIGNLRFRQDVSTVAGPGFGKPWFRLIMPSGIQVGEVIKTLEAEDVVAK